MHADSTKQFYIYILSRPDGRPFYVGKGHGSRCHQYAKSRNAHFKSVIAKYGKDNILTRITNCDSEVHAFELEMQTIRELRESGAKLVNATHGGEGAAGRVVSDATREKQRLKKLGKKMPPHVAELVSQRFRGGRLTEEHKAKIAASHVGIGHTEETRLKLRELKLGKTQTDEHRRKNSESNKGRTFTAEHRANISASQIGRKYSEEAKENMRKAWALRREKYGPSGHPEKMKHCFGFEHK
jgi:hypothetical protein